MVQRPAFGTIEIAGPQKLGFDEVARRYLRAHQDPRNVVTDVEARYFGAMLDDRSLTPDPGRTAWKNAIRRLAPR